MNRITDEMREQLNAMADGELGAGQREELLERVEEDSGLRDELCDIYRLKDMVRYAYAESKPPRRQQRTFRHLRLGMAVAATMLFTLGFLGGRMMVPGTAQLDTFELGEVQAQPNKIVLFVGYSDEEKFERVLDQAESLLQQRRGEGVEVNVVASAGGIDLLRNTDSPYLERIQAMAASYDVLEFIACNNTLARMAREGRPVELIKEAVVQPSAVQFVVERLRNGWSYMAI